MLRIRTGIRSALLAIEPLTDLAENLDEGSEYVISMLDAAETALNDAYEELARPKSEAVIE